MKRWLNVVAVILASLTIVVLTIFWVRSYAIGDYLSWHREPGAMEVYSANGLVYIGIGDMVSLNYKPPQGWVGSFWPFHRNVDRFAADLRRGTTIGFRYQRWTPHTVGLTADIRALTLPYGFVALCFAIMPAVFFRPRFFRKRF